MEWSSVLLTARAADLTSPDAHRQTSDIMKGLGENADAPNAPHRYEDGVYWTAVHAPKGVLASNEARLQAPDPIAAAGMVQLRRLLTDQDGPLFFPAPPLALRDALTNALTALKGDVDGSEALSDGSHDSVATQPRQVGDGRDRLEPRA